MLDDFLEVSKSSMNFISIFKISKFKSFKEFKEEYALPKSSIKTVKPFSLSEEIAFFKSSGLLEYALSVISSSNISCGISYFFVRL